MKYEQLLAAFLHSQDRKNPHGFRRALYNPDEANDYCLGGADSLAQRVEWGRKQAVDLHNIWKYPHRHIKSSKPTKCALLARLGTLRLSLESSQVCLESDCDMVSVSSVDY